AGFTKAQEGAERFVRGGLWRRTVGTLLAFLPVAKREFVLKDIKLFFRDTTQWSQLILLAVLVVVYLFNIKMLPLHRGEPVGFFYVTLVSFLNLGLAGFVLAAIAARFIFPAVSLEGRHMWLLRSSPLDLKTLLCAVLRALWTAVYAYVRAVYEGQPVVVDAWMISWFAVAAALCAAATALPLWVGLRRMERFEF